MLERAGSLLVDVHRGNMPLLLTCPHDGHEGPFGVPERTGAPPGCDFQKKRDLRTALVTERVAMKIWQATGRSPYVVVARFHRKFIDANRASECAYAAAQAAPFYEGYHSRVAAYVAEILRQNAGKGFLFDVHGTREIMSDRADVYIGTCNGATLLAGFDRRSIFMQHGLHGLLTSVAPAAPGRERRAYRVSPANDSAFETSNVSGGFTVRHYGSLINSIQLEIADTIRTDESRRDTFADDLALCLVDFVRRHAPF